MCLLKHMDGKNEKKKSHPTLWATVHREEVYGKCQHQVPQDQVYVFEWCLLFLPSLPDGCTFWSVRHTVDSCCELRALYLYTRNDEWVLLWIGTMPVTKPIVRVISHSFGGIGQEAEGEVRKRRKQNAAQAQCWKGRKQIWPSSAQVHCNEGWNERMTLAEMEAFVGYCC